MDINHRDEPSTTPIVEEPKSVEKSSPSEETKTENPSNLLEKAKANFEDTPGVDLCFMIDCTGSMASYIRMACNKVKDIMNQFKEIYPCSEIRVGIVGYRDVQDANRFDILPFTYCGETAKNFLDGLSANGGGDTPEDVNGAFQKTLFTMEWKMPVKMVIHIADAPCHGRDFHSYDDNHPEGYIEDLAWDKIFKELVEKRLDYVFLKISDMTNQMFEKFKAFAEEHGATKADINFAQELSLYQQQQNAPLGGLGFSGDLGLAPSADLCFSEDLGLAPSTDLGFSGAKSKAMWACDDFCSAPAPMSEMVNTSTKAASLFAEKITGWVTSSVSREVKKKE